MVIYADMWHGSHMDQTRFEWDPAKDRANQDKHAGYWRKGKSIYERENQIHR